LAHGQLYFIFAFTLRLAGFVVHMRKYLVLLVTTECRLRFTQISTREMTVLDTTSIKQICERSNQGRRMEAACNARGRGEDCIENFSRKTWKKSRRWEGNVRMDFRETEEPG
jgi:hypothetical protein